MSSLNSGLNNVFGSTYNGTTNNSATGTSGQTGSTANTFTAGQTGLQPQTATDYSNLLNGQVPSSFTAPAATMSAYNTNFQNNVEPGLVAQYGAGSPQIASQNALGMNNLLGQTYGTGLNAYGNDVANAANYGINATGTNTTGTGTTDASGATTSNATGNSQVLGSILNALLFGSGNLQTGSDRRLKKDIIDLEEGLALIKKLRSVRFKWNNVSSTAFGHIPDEAEVGFIAQEVADVLPEAVNEGHLGYYTLDKAQIIPVLVKALQQLLERVEKLETKGA